jgi:predicted kinase
MSDEVKQDVQATVADVAKDAVKVGEAVKADVVADATKVKETLRAKMAELLKEAEAKIEKGEKADLAKLKAFWNELIVKLEIK